MILLDIVTLIDLHCNSLDWWSLCRSTVTKL